MVVIFINFLLSELYCFRNLFVQSLQKYYIFVREILCDVTTKNGNCLDYCEKENFCGAYSVCSHSVHTESESEGMGKSSDGECTKPSARNKFTRVILYSIRSAMDSG